MSIRFLLFFAIVWGTKANISSTAVWEVRTTGNIANGGGFNGAGSSPGTDFSQQDAAQIAFTDLVIGVTTTELTSILNPIGATHVRNFINITGGTGCTVGIYEMVSQTSGTATMDRSVGTAASTCTGNLGGALASIANLTQVYTNTSTGDDGALVWVKAGTYGNTSTITVWNNNQLTLRGYNTTRGDITLSSQLTRPLITTATNSTILVNVNCAGVDRVTVYENLDFSNTASTRSFGFNAECSRSIIRLINCRLDGFSNAFQGNFAVNWNWSWLELFYVEIKNSTGVGIFNSNNGDRTNRIILRWCYIHDNASHGISISAEPIEIHSSIIESNGGSGLFSTNGVNSAIIHNSTFALNTGSGIDVSAGTSIQDGRYGLHITNSVFDSNGAFGVSAPSGNGIQVNAYNAYRNNTSGARNNFSAGVGDVTLTADPFTNAASGDFSLNSTSGGGAALKAVGFPGVIVTSTGFNSIGAVLPGASSTTSTIGIPSGN